jgi:hypothetical protein
MERKPRATNAERDEITRHLVALLAAGLQWGKIKKEMAARWGLSGKSLGRYRLRARGQFLDGCGTTAQEQLELSVAFWESIIRAPEATDRERMKAQAQLDRLFGLTRRRLRLRLGDLLAWKEKAAAAKRG